MAEKTETFTVKEVKHTPKFSEFKPGVIYVSSEFETVSFLCPCGCGGESNIPVDSKGWGIVFNAPGVLTLTPSILKMGGCKSHYFIRDNKVVWA